ncbi:MAG: MFS transporter [Opitutaceae bacterium]|nr:MFS transporter [Opitutaceae bacterium]
MLLPTKSRLPELYPHRHGLYFAFYNALNWQVGAGTPTVLLMEQLGADSFQVGLVYSWVFLLTPVQVLATAWLPRLGYKRLTLAGWGARGWFLLLPLSLALLAPEQPAGWMIPAMVAAMFFYSLSRSVGAAAITNWLHGLIPEPIRGRYWTTDQMLAGVGAVGMLLLGALLFAVLPAYPAFAIQYLIAILGAWMSWRYLNRLPDIDRPKVLSLEKIVADTPRLVLEPSQFRTYLWLAALLFVVTTPIVPFGTYYLKATAGLTSAHIMFYMMLYYAGVIGANAFMRSRLDRVGAKPFFRLSFVTYGVAAAGWMAFLYAGRGAGLILPLLFLLLGAAAACWTSANLNYLAKLLPAQERALPLSIHGAVIAFLGGVSPVIWGLFLKGEGPVPAVNVPVFAAFFGVVIVAMVCLHRLTAVLEEKAGPVEPLLDGSWLLRPFRIMTDLINLVDRSDDGRKD